MSKKAIPNNNKVIKASNFSKFGDGDDLIKQIQLKTITSLINNKKYAAQKISAEPPTTESQLLERLEQITSIQYELLTPFLGYTKQSPHLLLSKYVEDDNLNPNSMDEEDDDQDIYFLNEFFHEAKKQEIEWLNDTNKSKIALCVAKAMMVLHENNIVHGNLQPQTIKIVGKSHLPRLIDYGLNQFRGEPSEVNLKRCLAPELKKATNYSKETDVYAFGVLLCELLKSRNYRNLNEPDNYKKNSPKNLKNLISQCFNKNPKERPPFSEIYKQFKNHQTYFQTTDKNELEKTIKALDEIDDIYNNTKFKMLTELDNGNITQLYQLAKDVNPSNAKNFFNIIGNKFDKSTDDKLFKALLDVSLRFVQDPVYCKLFVETKVHLNLPFDKQKLFKQIFDIVYWIAQYEPAAVADLSESLAYNMNNPKCTKKILVILTCYQKSVCSDNNYDSNQKSASNDNNYDSNQKNVSNDNNFVSNPKNSSNDNNFVSNPKLWNFFDKVLSTLYFHKNIKYQSNFISVFYTLCKKVPLYKKLRIAHCVKVFSSLIDSKNNSTIRAIYAFLSDYKDEPIPEDSLNRFYKYTNKHLVNPHTAAAAAKFLLIRKDFKITKGLIKSAIRLASISRLGNFLLCRIAEDEKGSKMMMEKLDFIELPLPDLEGTLRVFLILIRKKKNLELYKHSESLPFFISNLSKNADLRMIKIIQNLLKIIGCDAKFIKELDENNFCREFLDSMLINGDHQTIKYALNIFKFFVIKCPQLEFYSELIKKLNDQIDLINQNPNSSSDLLSEILSLFALLSSIPNCIPLFKDFDVDEKFKKVKRNDYKNIEIKESFKKNIEAYCKHRERKDRKRSRSVPRNGEFV